MPKKNLFHEKVVSYLIKSEISQYLFHIMLSIILGIAAGAGAVLFHYLLEKMRDLFEPRNFAGMFESGRYLIIAVPVVGGLICASLTRLFPKVARQRGVLDVVKAIILNNGYIPKRVTLFHLVSPIISIGTGAPLGPEGPVAKIGSGIGSFLSQTFRLNRKDMMMYTAAGAGAAISAVFNAPIAGVFFGIEVILLNDMKNRALSALIISSVIADILSRLILGNHHVFTIPSHTQGPVHTYLFYLVLGLVCGMISMLFLAGSRWYGKFLSERLKIKNEFLKLLPVTLLFGLILTKYYQLFGIGYATINAVLARGIPIQDLAVLLLLKFVFVILFMRSGSYGGTFAPSLSIGAFSGYLFAEIAGSLTGVALDPVAFALAGMGGVLAGINSVPITAIMLVFEVTGDYRFILPLMLVSIISFLVTIYFNRSNVYTVELMNQGIDVTKRGEVDLLGKVRVKELMRTDFDLVDQKTSFRDLFQMLMNSSLGDVFVTDSMERLAGIITLKDVRLAITDNDLVDLLIARDLAAAVPSVREDDPVSLAIQKIKMYDIDTIPVINNDRDRKITGALTHHDILQAYNTLLEEWETSQFLTDRPGQGYWY